MRQKLLYNYRRQVTPGPLTTQTEYILYFRNQEIFQGEFPMHLHPKFIPISCWKTSFKFQDCLPMDVGWFQEEGCKSWEVTLTGEIYPKSRFFLFACWRNTMHTRGVWQLKHISCWSTAAMSLSLMLSISEYPIHHQELSLFLGKELLQTA